MATKWSDDGMVIYQSTAEGIKLQQAGTGVVSGGAIVQRAAGANMSVDVAEVTVRIGGTNYTHAAVNKTITAAHATLPRQDLVYATTAGIVVLDGTAAAAPGSGVNYPDPAALPSGGVPIGRVEVGIGVTSILNARIVDERMLLPDHGNLTGLADDDHTAYATNAELTAHEGAADPHTGYATDGDLTTHAALTATHGATGAVVGTTNSQTLTNKTLTTPIIADFTSAAHDHGDADDGGAIVAATVSIDGSMAAADKRLLAYFSAGNSGASLTIDWNNGASQHVTMTGNCTFTFSNPAQPGWYALRLAQDGTGSRIATWPATVKWSSATAPTLTTTASRVDLVTFYWDGAAYLGASILNYTV